MTSRGDPEMGIQTGTNPAFLTRIEQHNCLVGGWSEEVEPRGNRRMRVSATGSIWVGTANWMDHTGFYPRGTRPGDRLAYYARHLPLVEVNASFYRRIAPEIYARWAASTPAGFSFVVKAHRAVC